MLVEDIYSAAVQGDLRTLRRCLASCDADTLNQLWNGGADGQGVVVYQTVVYSILDATSGAFNFDVLKELADARADFNIGLTIEQNGRRITEPLLQHAISTWHSLELARFLLGNGADPNALSVNGIDTPMPTSTTMLWYAMHNWKSTRMMELLLERGADPSACCEIWSEGGYQYLPPLYYSFVELASAEKTQCLFRAGVKPDCLINDGYGETSIRQYVRECFPEREEELMRLYGRAARSAGSAGRAPVPVSGERTVSKRIRTRSGGQGARRASGAAASGFMESASGVLSNVGAALAGAGAFVAEKASRYMPVFVDFLSRVFGRIGAFIAERHRIQQKKREIARSKPWDGPCYNGFQAYLFANFGLLTLAFGLIGPVIYWKSEREVALIFLVIAIPMLLITLLIWFSVKNKADRSPYDGVMKEFVIYSILVMGKVLLVCTIVLIPLVKYIGGGEPTFQFRRKKGGGEVFVRERLDGTFVDLEGKEYRETDDPY